MTNPYLHRVTFLLLPLVAACSSDDGEFSRKPPFESVDDVRAWANSASAVGVWSNIHNVVAASDGEGVFPDPACPVVEDDGTTFTASGDCTEAIDDGKAWKGSVSVERDGDDRNITFEGFDDNEGTAAIHHVSDTLNEFEVHIVVGGVTTIDYMGSVQGGYDVPTLWNGSGHVARDGVIAPNGAVDATTLDQAWDSDICAGQALSGTTTLESGDDVAVITYDGADDCDTETDNALLSVNDEDRGKIGGIVCSLRAPGAAATSGLWSSLALLGLAVAALRRRATRTA